MAKKKIKESAIPADKTPECPPHHWYTDGDGNTRCKKCGETTELQTWHKATLNPEIDRSYKRGELTGIYRDIKRLTSF
jgi:hypothetical protein